MEREYGIVGSWLLFRSTCVDHQRWNRLAIDELLELLATELACVKPAQTPNLQVQCAQAKWQQSVPKTLVPTSKTLHLLVSSTLAIHDLARSKRSTPNSFQTMPRPKPRRIRLPPMNFVVLSGLCLASFPSSVRHLMSLCLCELLPGQWLSTDALAINRIDDVLFLFPGSAIAFVQPEFTKSIIFNLRFHWWQLRSLILERNRIEVAAMVELIEQPHRLNLAKLVQLFHISRSRSRRTV